MTPVLNPDLLLRAYAAGIFPMAESADDPELFWVDPIRRGVIAESDIQGDLFDLCAGAEGRRSAQEVTLFKSVGLALEDLAAASLAWEMRQKGATA